MCVSPEPSWVSIRPAVLLEPGSFVVPGAPILRPLLALADVPGPPSLLRAPLVSREWYPRGPVLNRWRLPAWSDAFYSFSPFGSISLVSSGFHCLTASPFSSFF